MSKAWLSQEDEGETAQMQKGMGSIQNVRAGPQRPEEHSASAYLLYAINVTHSAFPHLFSVLECFFTLVPVPVNHQG